MLKEYQCKIHDYKSQEKNLILLFYKMRDKNCKVIMLITVAYWSDIV